MQQRSNLSVLSEIATLPLVARNDNVRASASIQSLVVAAAFRLRQSMQAEACGYKNPPLEDIR